MFDGRLRATFNRPLNAMARRAAGRGVRAWQVTLVGFGFGVGACVAIGFDRRWWALGLWLLNRAADGLDGALARRVGATELGGFFDIVADFAVYGGFVVALAIANADARLAAVVLLGTYYISGAALLAWSSIAERHGHRRGDNRSFHFVGGLAEGAETIVVYALVCVWPAATVEILWAFSGAVGFTALQRVVFVWRSSSAHDASGGRDAGGSATPET
ncbi:MAG: CDP-alcohol phosphatidyltransferase family protein [Acidimicrobiales bacterium]